MDTGTAACAGRPPPARPGPGASAGLWEAALGEFPTYCGTLSLTVTGGTLRLAPRRRYLLHRFCVCVLVGILGNWKEV